MVEIADIKKKLQCWNLLARFRGMLEDKLSDHPLSKSELDPRRELGCLDYCESCPRNSRLLTER